MQNEIEAAGHVDGNAWSNGHATKGQLRRLRQFYALRSVRLPSFAAWCANVKEVGEEPKGFIAGWVTGRGDSHPLCRGFWNKITGEVANLDDPDYLEGFIKGALGV
ncbi:MAG TPA: hypothetical protein VHV55_14620 [Pirellulales bacterium]|nr:hypothetical protein [Pirellulales bacterium]